MRWKKVLKAFPTAPITWFFLTNLHYLGANVNMRLGMDADGDEPNAPLLAAAANGHTAVVKYLLDHKDIISGVVTRVSYFTTCFLAGKRSKLSH